MSPVEEVCNLSWYHSNGSYPSYASSPIDLCPVAYPTHTLDKWLTYHIKGQSSSRNHEELLSSPLSAMWKVWVLSDHLSAKDYTKMVLTWLFGSSSNPAAYTKALVSSLRALYHKAMRLVLPLLENEGKTYKKDERKAWKSHLDKEIGEKWYKIMKIRLSECQRAHAGLRMHKQGP